jgi:hypothetical protein
MEVNRNLTLQGKIVLSVGLFTHKDKIKISDEEKKMLDKLHLEKISLSDSIYVIDKDGYIGESTKNEIEFAKKKGKAIEYYSLKGGK